MKNTIWLAFVLTAAAQNVDPNPPMSAARRTRIDALREKAALVSARFEEHSFKGSDGDMMPYRLFRPAIVEQGQKYSLVLSGGNLFGSHGWALAKNQARHRAFVLAPQTDQGCGYRGVLQEGEPEPAVVALGAKIAFELLDSILAELPIDNKRVYVSGQSMGGVGSWYLAMRTPIPYGI